MSLGDLYQAGLSRQVRTDLGTDLLIRWILCIVDGKRCRGVVIRGTATPYTTSAAAAQHRGMYVREGG